MKISVSKPQVLIVFGTRPEAIKLCPLVLQLRRHWPEIGVRVCVTAQHRQLLDPILRVFAVKPDYDLDCMRPGQTLFQSTTRILAALESVVADAHPNLLVVQGDTTTTLCGALAGYYGRIPVGHVEAGLRTNNLAAPFPEELNRVLVGRIAGLHFAATEWAAANLRAEQVPADAITITGNTGIDAVFHVRDQLLGGRWPGCGLPLTPERKLILITAHRRESFGSGFEQICAALADLAAREDVEIVYPVHPNPEVREPVHRYLEGKSRVWLIEPLEYAPFVDLLLRSWFVLTDSGGVQEEAPSLGKPVLVLRNVTERPEGVKAGTARLVGTNRRRIVEECERLLEDREAYETMACAHNPYGDGRASERIAGRIWQFLNHPPAE